MSARSCRLCQLTDEPFVNRHPRILAIDLSDRKKKPSGRAEVFEVSATVFTALHLTKEISMKKQSTSQSGLFNPRAFVAFTLCCVGVLLAMVSFAAPGPGPAPLTFGHPVITGIGGVGFEQGLRLDPSNPNLLYTSVPGSLSSDTSWVWHSLDGGKTFKWVVAATPLEGKVHHLLWRRRYRNCGGLGGASLLCRSDARKL